MPITNTLAKKYFVLGLKSFSNRDNETNPLSITFHRHLEHLPLSHRSLTSTWLPTASSSGST